MDITKIKTVYYNISEEQKQIYARIRMLKHQLSITDYQAIKYAEGLISAEDYQSIKEQRQAWRDEINQLEAELAQEE